MVSLMIQEKDKLNIENLLQEINYSSENEAVEHFLYMDNIPVNV